MTKVDTFHGDTREDPYYWLREKSNPEVEAYLSAENAYTAAVMAPTAGFQKTIYEEIVGRIKETDLSVPYRRGVYWYYSRTEEGKQYPIHCRKRGSMDGPEEVLLDVNELAEGVDFLQLWTSEVSDDANRLAYTTDVTGFREYTLYVKDLPSGELLPVRIREVTEAVWAADEGTLFYVVEDEAKRPYRVYRHRIGAAPDGSSDDLVYQESDELFRISLGRSLDGEYVSSRQPVRRRRRSATSLPIVLRAMGASFCREKRVMSTTSCTARVCSTSGPTRLRRRSAS